MTKDGGDLCDFSVGARLTVWREWVNAFAHVLVPLNRPGLDAVPLVGLEVTL